MGERFERPLFDLRELPFQSELLLRLKAVGLVLRKQLFSRLLGELRFRFRELELMQFELPVQP
ncbi:hypothetical protein [Mumia zhuanghuii]|uniref:Uncharacterized protein n=1 Tax=Mumia zhuanghuii TaxID=2585211 RepID=A0A5C4MBS3_9ACTN|nr:hypothetical protein [Mumia zhuanghuii]TNC32521.1 hypothetical protein FHE65_30345 [Mumia zhuanghuii]